MTSHELAAILLRGPNLPVAAHANNHTYAPRMWYEKLHVVVATKDAEQSYVVIGNLQPMSSYVREWTNRVPLN